MSYNKVYENKPIWHNDREPAINETRLNALSGAVDTIDNRVIELGDRGVENLPDVSITDLQDGQGIKWNEELQKWENGVVGGIVDITNAEYEYLVEHDLDDRTVTYNITDRNPDGTLIDDSLTQSATKTWSIDNLSNKFSDINSNLTPVRIDTITPTNASVLIADIYKIGHLMNIGLILEVTDLDSRVEISIPNVLFKAQQNIAFSYGGFRYDLQEFLPVYFEGNKIIISDSGFPFKYLRANFVAILE